MNSLRNIMTILGMLICAFGAQAQPPGWTLNTEAYQYTMTIVAFLSVDNKILIGEQDKVAAFSGGEIRGVAHPIYVSSADRYLAYLTVFSNKEEEQIEFKLYNSSGDKVVNAAATLSFKIDDQQGNVFQAFSIASPALSNEASIKNFFFTEVDSVATTISEGQLDIVLEYDQDLRNLSPEFIISDGAKIYLDRILQVSGDTTFDFSDPVSYSVLSEDESVLNTWLVSVSNRQTTENGFVSTNVITLNNDGSNDYWIVRDVFKYDNCDFRIFDANGRILFESTGYKNDWNGYYKDARVARGKYYYVIKDPDTNTLIRGDILVLY